MLSFSEDFCNLATAVNKPALLFAYGATPIEKLNDPTEIVPGNHSSLFAPDILPTMKAGIDAYALGALACLASR